MARLSSNGTEIARVDYLTVRRSYRSNGWILKNDGSGWKRESKLKPGHTVDRHFVGAVGRFRAYLQTVPEYSDYRSALHNSASLRHRSRLHEIIRLMPDDPDAVYSTFDDMGYGDNPRPTLSECVELCDLYRTYWAAKPPKRIKA